MNKELIVTVIKCAACGGKPYGKIADINLCKACYEVVMASRAENRAAKNIAKRESALAR